MSKSYIYFQPPSDLTAANLQRLRLLRFANQPLGAVAPVVEETAARSLPWSKRHLGSLLGEHAGPGDWVFVAEVGDLGASLSDVYSCLALAAERGVTISVMEGSITIAPATASAATVAATLRIAATVAAEFHRARTRSGLRRAAAEGRRGGRRKGSTGRLKLDPRRSEIAVQVHLGLSAPKIAERFGVTEKTMRRFLARHFPKAG